MHIYCSDMAGHWALRRLACQQQRMHSTTRKRKEKARERGRARAKPDNPIFSDCWPSAQGVARVDKSRLLEGELRFSRLWADRSLYCSRIVWYLAEVVSCRLSSSGWCRIFSSLFASSPLVVVVIVSSCRKWYRCRAGYSPLPRHIATKS
jgi:hypothetical protein